MIPSNNSNIAKLVSPNGELHDEFYPTSLIQQVPDKTGKNDT